MTELKKHGLSRSEEGLDEPLHDPGLHEDALEDDES